MRTIPANKQAKLIEEHLPWARKIALATYNKIGPPRHLRDDFISSAYLGLVESARRWDRTIQEDFRKFAVFRVTGEIYNFIPRSIGLSSRAYKELGRLREQYQEYETCTGAVQALIEYLGLEDFDGASPPDPEEACIQLETRKQVRSLMSKLPSDLSRTLRLRYFRNKTPGEVAALSNKSVATISNRNREALGYLREMIAIRVPELQNLAA